MLILRIILFRLFFLIIAVNFCVFTSNAQNVSIDTTNSKQLEISSNDSLFTQDIVLVDSMHVNVDSLFVEQVQDTLNKNLNINDSLISNVNADSISMVYPDSLIGLDSTLKVATFKQVMNQIEDSLFFENPDTIHYIIYNLNKLVNSDTILTDTTKQAIHKLIDYSTNREIDTVIQYLKRKLQYALTREYKDSTIKTYNDSIFKAVRFLIESIPEDSIKFSFTNLNNDSILFDVPENDIDSIRLNLYDNRGEYGTLWIKKSDTNVFELFLEEGIYIEKAKQRKVVNQKLDTQFKIPQLKKMKKVERVIPIWDFDGSADIKFNQGYISKSWSEGGESSISALSILKYSADYSYGKKISLDTDFEYRLGYLKAGDNELQKNDDKFEINAKYGRSAINNWYYSALLNFKTQLFKGKEYPNDSTVNIISEFLSPAYLVFSLGLDYKPSKKLTILISPITSKFTIVADTVNYDQTRFGVGQNEYVRKEIGAYVKAISKLKFRNNIILENKINFFTNYTKNPQNIDVDWEVNLGIKLTDYITMSVNAHYIYDDDVDVPKYENGNQVGITKKGQFKELFGVGFIYSF